MKPRTKRREPAPPHPEFLEGLLDNTRLVVYLKDADGRYLYVNRRYELLAGVPREALLGKVDHDFFPPAVADLFRAQDSQVARTRKSAEFEETIPLPGGERSFITEKFPLFDEAGAVCATGGFCTETTTQKNRADESLAEERERLAVTIRSISTGIVATDASGVVVLLNPAAEALMGLRQAEAAGRRVDEVLRAGEPVSDGVFGRLAFEALEKGQASAARDVVMAGADGRRRIVAPYAAAVRDRAGKIIGAVLCLRDMTELRQADEELFKIRSLESLGFLAGGIAHDFNNLLAGILANLDLLEEQIAPADPARELLTDAKSICGKASALSRKLLTLADGTAVERKTFRPGPLAVETARLILGRSNVKCATALPRSLWTIEGDDAQFTQILVNLLVNAREAMPGGGSVRIEGENRSISEATPHLPAGRYVELRVRDDGPGIPAAILDRVFNPYFSSKARGSGLGLAIVHSIVRRHGGSVRVESKEGEGTVFTLLLPASGKSAPRVSGRRGRARRSR